MRKNYLRESSLSVTLCEGRVKRIPQRVLRGEMRRIAEASPGTGLVA